MSKSKFGLALPMHFTRLLGDSARSYFTALACGAPFTSAITGNKLYAVPILFAKRTKADRLTFVVTGGVTGNAIAGIYGDNGNAYPGKLLLTGSAFDVSSTGNKETTISFTFSEGLFWLALNSNAAPTIRWEASPFPLPFAFDSSDWSAAYRSVWRADFTYTGSLPDPFTAGGTAPHADVPMIMVRLAKL